MSSSSTCIPAIARHRRIRLTASANSKASACRSLYVGTMVLLLDKRGTKAARTSSEIVPWFRTYEHARKVFRQHTCSCTFRRREGPLHVDPEHFSAPEEIGRDRPRESNHLGSETRLQFPNCPLPRGASISP